MSSKSLKRTAEIVVLCVCAAVVWGCESDAQKYAGELKIRHAICMNKAGTFNASASVQCLCENTPDLRLSSAYVCSEGVRVSCDSAPQFCESNGAGEIGRLTYCSAGVWKTGYCECNANQNGCRECDETKDLPVCYSDNGQIVSRYCDNGEFKFDVCTKGCNVNGECNQECDPTNAEAFCYDSDSTHEVRKCVNGVYKTMETCDLGCTNGKCNAECNTGEEKCENLAHYTCNDGMWEIKEYCPLGCDDKNKTCRNAACTDNVCIMPENTVGYLYNCKDGKISENPSMTCENEASCSGSSTCGKCKNGEKKCVNDIVHVCNNGEFVQTEDDCGVRICIDGDAICNDDNKLNKCVDGQWKNTDCSLDGAFCDASLKQCKKIECSFGDDAKCAGRKSINECGNDRQWNTTSCNNDNICVHTDSGDKCAACKPGIKLCESNMLKTCNSEGEWIVEDCPRETPFCVDKTCVECSADEVTCHDSNGVGVVSECINYEWKNINCDNDASCKSDSECGECKNGTTQCVNGEYNIGVVQTCKNGIWDQKEDDPCNDLSCNIDGTDCGACLNGEANCEEKNTPKNCVNGQWGVSKNCSGNESCRIVGGVAKCTECEPFEKECVLSSGRGRYRVCNTDGSWKTAQPCSEDIDVCANNNMCGGDVLGCTNGEMKCFGDTLKICEGAEWSEVMDCTKESRVCDYSSSEKRYDCLACHPNKTQCVEDNKAYRVCNADGNWDDPKECTRGCDNTTGMCKCDATKLKISPDGFKYNIASDGFEDNYAPISDWSLECDNTKGLLIKDLGVCTGEILLSTGGNCSKLPYIGYVGLDKMEGQKPVTLCKDTTLQMESGESNQGSYKLQFTIGKSLVTLNVSVCSSGCVGNVCSNMQNGKQCRCGSEMINSFTTCCSGGSPYICLGGDLIDCSGTSLCASTCNGKCSETNNTTITISNQLVTVCDKGVKQTYYMFSYACDDTDVIKKLNLYSGDTGPTLALTPYGTSTLDCNSLLNKDFDYPKGSTANTIISGSGTLCAVDANSASGGKFAFVFDDHEDPKSVHADKGVCNVCVDNAVCSTHSDCNGGVCMPGKIGGSGKCICESKPVQCPTGTGPRTCFDIDDNGDICYGTCKGTDCVCEATM